MTIESAIMELTRKATRAIEKVRYFVARTFSKWTPLTKPVSGRSEFVWSLGYANCCDVTPFSLGIPAKYTTCPILPRVDPRAYVRPTRRGSVVWLAGPLFEIFVRRVFPQLQVPITLVLSDGDDAFPSVLGRSIDMDKFLLDSRILAVFAQNNDGSHPSRKIHSLPIGLDFHSQNRPGGYWGGPQQTAKEQESELNRIVMAASPVEDRDSRAFVDFHLSDRTIYDGSSRREVFGILKQTAPIFTLDRPLPRTQLWRQKTRFAFSISPHGNGLDCHRTWEDLALGCIVIVKTSPLDELYHDLPVAIVNSWTEVNSSAMAGWLARLGPLTRDLEARRRLTLSYWMTNIRSTTEIALRSLDAPRKP